MSITVRVHYAPPAGDVVLRTSGDWDRELPADRASADGTVHEFDLDPADTYCYFKPVLRNGDGVRWSVGHNYLALAVASAPIDVFPHFREDAVCSVCTLREIASPDGRVHRYRIFYPPGYHENEIKRYPVLYMQDGQNLFFPDEAFGGSHWRIEETLGLLEQMNLVDRIIVVGVYPNDRMRDYTSPGYESYGRFLVETLKPAVDAEYRTLTDPRSTAAMGSSLGGVVSFYLAWQWPEVFGGAACLSSTFGYRDDLRRRVSTEPRRPIRVYLDTGWPHDNFEVTRDMRTLLVQRGLRDGVDLLYLAFPEGRHNESSWATRCHIPFQFLYGKHPAPNGRGRGRSRLEAAP